jgi:hypothetical protein
MAKLRGVSSKSLRREEGSVFSCAFECFINRLPSLLRILTTPSSYVSRQTPLTPINSIHRSVPSFSHHIDLYSVIFPFRCSTNPRPCLRHVLTNRIQLWDISDVRRCGFPTPRWRYSSEPPHAWCSSPEIRLVSATSSHL